MYDQMFKFWACLDDYPNGSKAVLLLMELEGYFDGAAAQTARLGRTRKTIIRKLQEHREARKLGEHTNKKFNFGYFERLHHDYHFYFICISQINKLLKRLCEVLDDDDLKKVHENFKKKFGTAITIRNDLEHIDERALGKRKKEDIGHIADFGNFAGDSFTFHGKKFPVNKEKLKELDQTYKEIINVLYKNYGSKDPHLIWLEQSERWVKKILRDWKKQGRL
jgi:hypothetical protein